MEYHPASLAARTLQLLDLAHNYNEYIASYLYPYLGHKNLELGAGLGSISEQLLQHPGEFTLIEPAPANQETLRQRFAGNKTIRSIKSDIAHISGDAALDCIYSSNVLEHIQDDAEVLGLCMQRLNKGGHFAAIVPAGKWLYSQADERLGHYRRYTASDINKLCTKINDHNIPCKIVRMKYINIIGALGWFYQMRMRHRVELRKTDIGKIERLIKYIRILDICSLPWGQSLLFVLRKD